MNASLTSLLCKLVGLAALMSFSSGAVPVVGEFAAGEILIEADGRGGEDTYEILRRSLGESCIEAPETYPNNHLGDRHITENDDSPYGPYFTFVIHRDFDEDKNDDGAKGRQRNEIRGDDKSSELVKARQGESIYYHWYFRIGSDYLGAENHTIFFQLHNVDVGPIVKIQSMKSDLVIRHDPDNGNKNEIVLDSHPFDELRGQWLEVTVHATFSNSGYLRMSVQDESGKVVLFTERRNLDMWTSNFTRPKWGIYRAFDKFITNSEDTADFADITIRDLSAATPVEKPEKTGANLEAYPNPFENRATVAVTLDAGAAVRLDVHDPLGRRVATLLDDFLPVGRSELLFNARGLAAGPYTLSLHADDRQDTRTILHVRR